MIEGGRRLELKYCIYFAASFTNIQMQNYFQGGGAKCPLKRALLMGARQVACIPC